MYIYICAYAWKLMMRLCLQKCGYYPFYQDPLGYLMGYFTTYSMGHDTIRVLSFVKNIKNKKFKKDDDNY